MTFVLRSADSSMQHLSPAAACVRQHTWHPAAGGHALAMSHGVMDLVAAIKGHTSTTDGGRSSALPAPHLVVHLKPIEVLLPHLQVHVGWLPEGTAVFAFRGTDTAQDGLQDVKIMRRNIDYLQDLFPGVKAHVGGCCQPVQHTCPAWCQASVVEVKARLGLCCSVNL